MTRGLASLAALVWIGCAPGPAKCVTKAGLTLIEGEYQTTCERLQPWEDQLIRMFTKFGYRDGFFSRWSLVANREIEPGNIDPSYRDGRGLGGRTRCIGQVVDVGELTKSIRHSAYGHEMMHVLSCELGIREYADDQWEGHGTWGDHSDPESKWHAVEQFQNECPFYPWGDCS